MPIWIALLRAVNVGGNNKLPMASLVSLLEDAGCRDVRTYIQSGNAVVRSEGTDAKALAGRIGDAVLAGHGFRPGVIVLDVAELEHAVTKNPFPEAEPDPAKLHLFFLSDSPREPDLDTLNNAKAESERFALDGNLLYLHAPDGVGRSKFPAKIEPALGVEATARNWRTVNELLEMAREAT
jgi:uncharacterized protein (DUF1697 family)